MPSLWAWQVRYVASRESKIQYTLWRRTWAIVPWQRHVTGLTQSLDRALVTVKLCSCWRLNSNRLPREFYSARLKCAECGASRGDMIGVMFHVKHALTLAHLQSGSRRRLMVRSKTTNRQLYECFGLMRAQRPLLTYTIEELRKWSKLTNGKY